MSARTRALVALAALAAVARFATLGTQSFDFDESFTVAIVNGSLGHVVHAIPQTESSPPLYYLLAWLWSQLFGVGEYGLRALSALLGAALAPVGYLVAARLSGSQRAGVLAGLLIALNPLLVWYSQEARTYSLLALLGALSFWAFVAALERPDGRRLGLWAAASAAALLSHYFAGFLVLIEGVWLLWATRRRAAVLACAAVALVAAALVPLIVSQADNRTDWIANLSFGSRVKEVTKKLVTGELDPTHNWQLALVALLAGGAIVYCWRLMSARERRGALLAWGVGIGAITLPAVVDVFGFRYLISKNVIAALPVLLIGAGVVLGAGAVRAVGLAGAGAALVLFAVLVLDGAVDPVLQRPDLRGIARALGPPVRDQAVVTPHLGDMPLALYRPGAELLPERGWPVRQVVVAWPVSQEVAPPGRVPTPSPPEGFAYAGRRDGDSYTLICFDSPVAQVVHTGSMLALSGSGASTVQVWPRGQTGLEGGPSRGSPCAAAGR